MGMASPSGRAAAALALALAAAGALPSAAAAQQPAPAPAAAPFVGRPVASVVLQVEGHPTTDPVLIDLVSTPAGQPLSMEAVRETLAHLFNIGRFQGIDVVARDAPNGAVALEYLLMPLHAVASLEFRGDLGISDDDLRRAVVERFGKAPPAGRADAAARVLEQLLARRGFLRARVEPAIRVRHDPDRTILVFNVQAGARARIGSVQIAGVRDTERVAAALDLHAGGAFEPDRLDERLSRFVQSLRKRGYYESSAGHQATPRAGGEIVDVAVDVRQGPIVKLAFEGDPLPRNRVAELVPIEREGSVDEDLLEDADIRIRNFLLEQGHWKAHVTHRREVGDDVETITFTVTRGRRFVVNSIEISGNQAFSTGSLRPLVPLGPGDPFVEGRLGTAVAAIRALYLHQGFTTPTIHVANSETAAGGVDMRIAIREGVQTRVGAVSFEGNDVLGDDELRRLTQVAPGAVFYAPAVAADRDRIHLEYLNRGHAAASVTVEPTFATDRSRADLVYRITEGPWFIVDHVIVVGNTKTSEETIRRELLVEAGKPLALADVMESQRRLSALGLFRRVRITEVPHGDEPRRDIVVTVEEADRTTVAYGGGLELAQRTVLGTGGIADERLEVAPRGSFEIGRRNLWGRNRSVNFFTRVSFRPRGESIESPESANYGFNEYRVVGTYREVGAFGRLADVAVNAFVEQAIRSSFNFSRRGVNAEAQRRLTPYVRVTGRYGFGRTRLFDERIATDEKLNIDRVFPRVRLSSVSFSAYRDTRDHPLDPTRGWLLGSDSELAARSIGSQVGFAKTYVQALGFRTLSRERNVVLAAALRVGLARGFAQDVNGQIVVDDLPASERFFAGGSTTVRGFALDKLGAPDTIAASGFAIGGNALLVMNAEIRTPLWRDVGVVAFLDAGNVFARIGNVDVSELRASPGFGLRYRSPIGPIRVDLGFKLRRRELSPGNFEGLTAFHISVGHAF